MPIGMEEHLERLKKIEDAWKKSQGITGFATKFRDFALYPDSKLPDKFKIPEFAKYDGTSCPIAHLKAYCADVCPLEKY